MKSRWVFLCVSPSKNPLNSFAEISSTCVLNHVEISHLLSVSARQASVLLGSSLHASIIKNQEFSSLDDEFQRRNAVVVWNSLLSNYVKCGSSSDAVKLFDRMPLRDTISWNIMVSGFLRDNGDFEMGFRYLKQMIASDVCKVDHATWTTILSVCDGPEFSCITKMIHGLVILYGFKRGISVANALITSYCKCECWSLGKQIFDEMLERDVISWTAIISGLARNDCCEASLRLFAEMHSKSSVNPNTLTYLGSLLACSGLQAVKEGSQVHGIVWKIGIQSDLCIESALMDMYSKSGSLDDSWRIFVSAKDLDEVSLTVILAGFAQNGYEEEAIQLFMKMMKQGLEIDPNVVSTVLGVFSENTSLKLGQQVHSLIIKKNFSCNQFVGNGLINMYSKCGDMEESFKIFRRMSQRSQITWNSMIAAFARHGNGFEALKLYEKMVLEGTKPTDVTFLSLLHACSHVGLVNQGLEYLKSMIKDHALTPRTEHYACIVDMLGRAGLLTEARDFIEELPKNPDLQVWQALLGACSIHGDSEMGKYAANKLLSDSPESPSPYVLLANIYSSEENWRERARALRRMKDVGITKEAGTSWIEIEKKVHSFVVCDRTHPQGEAIYGVLLELFKLMTDEGYVPEKKFIRHCSDEEELCLPSQ